MPAPEDGKTKAVSDEDAPHHHQEPIPGISYTRNSQKELFRVIHDAQVLTHPNWGKILNPPKLVPLIVK